MNNETQSTKKPPKIEKIFRNFASRVDKVVGSPYWFVFSLTIVIIWLPSGFLLGFNEIWHLIINTTTTILTFLMLSLLHSTQQKWEDRIEKMLSKEHSHIREIGKDTKRIVEVSSQAETPQD